MPRHKHERGAVDLRVPRQEIQASGSGFLHPQKHTFPKNPWDVMGCQVATCFEAPGVSLGGSGVSIGGFRILRVPEFFSRNEISLVFQKPTCRS